MALTEDVLNGVRYKGVIALTMDVYHEEELMATGVEIVTIETEPMTKDRLTKFVAAFGEAMGNIKEDK